MKRLSQLGFFGLFTVGLLGCPVWDDDSGQGYSYACQDEYCCHGTCSGGTGGGGPSCDRPADCPTNQTCAPDGQCHSGDCTIWGCVDGFICEIAQSGFPECLPGGDGGAGGAGGGSTTTTGGGGSGGNPDVIWCGNPDDCAAGQTCAPDGTCHVGDCTANDCIYGYACDGTTGLCSPTNPAACGNDGDCSGSGTGYLCVDGIGTAPADQCFDQTQCIGAADEKCAGGKCVPGCASDSECTSSYTCDTTTGICSVAAKPCTITNDCGGPNEVCVDGACVPRSTGGSCDPGSTWVENGCVPTQGATFTCSVDGTQDACASGSICLHHSCYISCDADATVCDNLPLFTECKDVASSSGTHKVCGSSENFGGECDPTAGIECTDGKICVDGFCK